jgi:hypothetical protein
VHLLTRKKREQEKNPPAKPPTCIGGACPPPKHPHLLLLFFLLLLYIDHPRRRYTVCEALSLSHLFFSFVANTDLIPSVHYTPSASTLFCIHSTLLRPSIQLTHPPLNPSRRHSSAIPSTPISHTISYHTIQYHSLFPARYSETVYITLAHTLQFSPFSPITPSSLDITHTSAKHHTHPLTRTIAVLYQEHSDEKSWKDDLRDRRYSTDCCLLAHHVGPVGGRRGEHQDVRYTISNRILFC